MKRIIYGNTKKRVINMVFPCDSCPVDEQRRHCLRGGSKITGQPCRKLNAYLKHTSSWFLRYSIYLEKKEAHDSEAFEKKIEIINKQISEINELHNLLINEIDRLNNL